MKYTYDTFTQLRSSIDMPKECVIDCFFVPEHCFLGSLTLAWLSISLSRAEPSLQLRYPPHGPEAVKALTGTAYLPIPPSTPDGR